MATQNNRVLRGRQALLIVYQFYAINATLGAAYSIVDLVGVTWMGDGKIEMFLDRWSSVPMSMPSLSDRKAIEQLFLTQMRKSTVFATGCFALRATCRRPSW